MKTRIIFLSIFIVFAVLLIISLVTGLEKIGILSISQINNKDNEVTKKIQTISNLTSTDYPNKIKTLEEDYNKLLIEKEKYEELVSISGEENTGVRETKKYDIEYLWKTIGKKATARNLDVTMDLQKTSETNLYNLSFKMTGEYTNISQFIADLENDSNLLFRIYNFEMTGNESAVNAEITVKNINIKSISSLTVAGNNATGNTNVSSETNNE